MSESNQITEKINQVSQAIESRNQLLELTEESAQSCPFKHQLLSSYPIEDKSSPAKRAIVSLLLYIRENNLRVLSISRSIVKELHDKDPNWPTSKVFSDADYKLFIEIIKGFGIRKITKFANYKPSVFYVDQESPVSTYITEDATGQIKDIFTMNEISRSSFVNDEILQEFEDFLPQSLR